MNPTNKILLSTVLAVGLATSQMTAIRSNPPKIHGETANGRSLELPDAAVGKVTLLILGFSKAGGQQTGVWQQHVSGELGHDPHFTIYTIAVLESVPSLFRGMVKSGIRSGTPKAERDHMVTTVSGEAAWKQFAGVSDDRVPYLVLLDGTGHVRWTGHGLFEERQDAALRAAVRDLEAEENGR
jgi:hypothetical protein